MGTFRGHENSRNLKFNETQRGKRSSNKRNELPRTSPRKWNKMKSTKEENIWFRGTFFLLCDSKNWGTCLPHLHKHVICKFISGKKHKIYKNKRVISFSIFLKTYFDSSSKNPCNELCKSMTKSLWIWVLVIFVDLKILFVFSLPKHRKRFLTQWLRIITLDWRALGSQFSFLWLHGNEMLLFSNFLAFQRCVSGYSQCSHPCFFSREKYRMN